MNCNISIVLEEWHLNLIDKSIQQELFIVCGVFGFANMKILKVKKKRYIEGYSGNGVVTRTTIYQGKVFDKMEQETLHGKI